MKGSSSMKKMNNRKGFTLAELLIVVAIIAVLVAIAIPIFTTQLERAREATDLANIRSAYAEVVTKYLGDGLSHTASISVNQRINKWQTNGSKSVAQIGTEIAINGGSKYGYYPVTAHVSGKYQVQITKDGTVTIH